MLDKKLQAYAKKERIPRPKPAKYKEEFPFLKEVDSFALYNVQLQLEKAFKEHFRNCKQFKIPRFKKKRDKQSYTTNNVHNSIRVDFEKGLLYLPQAVLKSPKSRNKRTIRIIKHKALHKYTNISM